MTGNGCLLGTAMPPCEQHMMAVYILLNLPSARRPASYSSSCSGYVRARICTHSLAELIVPFASIPTFTAGGTRPMIYTDM